jgi:hypothetical protein
LKGLIRYQRHDAEKKLSFLWLPFGISWGEPSTGGAGSGQMDLRSEQ